MPGTVHNVRMTRVLAVLAASLVLAPAACYPIRSATKAAMSPFSVPVP